MSLLADYVLESWINLDNLTINLLISKLQGVSNTDKILLFLARRLVDNLDTLAPHQQPLRVLFGLAEKAMAFLVWNSRKHLKDMLNMEENIWVRRASGGGQNFYLIFFNLTWNVDYFNVGWSDSRSFPPKLADDISFGHKLCTLFTAPGEMLNIILLTSLSLLPSSCSFFDGHYLRSCITLFFC